MMELRLDGPHIKARCRDGTAWCLPMEERASFEYAWTQSKAFWWGVSLWGSPIVIKLADVTGMVTLTAETLALFKAEADEEAERAMIHGNDA